jgi:molybdate transport system regulatory protein
MSTTAVRFRVHFGRDTSVGPGKVDLLEQIERTGSLSQAARQLQMSYRRAWVLLHSLNTSYREPVVITAKGGRGGGGATLTAFGHELVRVYRRFDADLQRRATRSFGAIAAQVARSRRRGTARGAAKRR